MRDRSYHLQEHRWPYAFEGTSEEEASHRWVMPVNADAVPRPPKPLEYAVALLVTNSNSPNHGVQRAGVCLGDVVDHLQDDPAPSNASDTKESYLPNTLVCRTSTMDPTLGNPELSVLK